MNEKLDILKKPLCVGDHVIYSPAGSYSGLSLGVIEKFTPKGVGVRALKGGRGRHVEGGTKEKLYYTGACDVAKYEASDDNQ